MSEWIESHATATPRRATRENTEESYARILTALFMAE